MSAADLTNKIISLGQETAALRAENAQQKERIAFLERAVTQMIHTAYNADNNCRSRGDETLTPVPRGTTRSDEMFAAAAAIEHKFHAGTDKPEDWDRLQKALGPYRISPTNPLTQ